MGYRCEAISVEGFVQQVAVSYIANGYFFYVAGSVPNEKDPAMVDRKIIDRYDIGISKWAKARRKQLGQANLQYIRFERFFLILATHGQHRFFEDEAKMIRDVRRIPIRFAGYSISHRNGHASVRIERNEYRMLKAFFMSHAVDRSVEWHRAEISKVPYVFYAPIRRQLGCIVRALNRKRKEAGLEEVSISAVVLKRQIKRPFDSEATKFVCL